MDSLGLSNRKHGVKHEHMGIEFHLLGQNFALHLVQLLINVLGQIVNLKNKLKLVQGKMGLQNFNLFGIYCLYQKKM